MAITQNTYTGDGSTTTYSFTFPYLETVDVKASINGVLTTAYTLATATTLAFTTAPANGAAIRIFRDTNTTGLKATFYPGSAIRSTDLNDNFTQNLYVTQETDNDVVTANTTADTAKTTANTALSNSNTAVSDAASAVSTANTASTNATNAVNTANTASTNASNAVSTANAAAATANTASTNASNAVATANATSAAQTALEANVYDSTELDAGQLDNRYYTETELNNGQLDNRYYTETESDTKYFQKNTNSIESTETWVSNDSNLATTAAIDARLVLLVDDVGGFVPVTTHTNFPNANPDINNDAGTVVSIANISGLTHSGGTSSNATRVGGGSVVINGIPTSIASPAPEMSMLVVTTSTDHEYTFHKAVANVNDQNTVANISSDITTVAGIASTVTAVNNNSSNITTVANINSNVTTVATNITDVRTVSADINNVNINASNSTVINTVGNNISNVNTAASNMSAIIAAPTEASNAASSASAASTSETNAASSATAAATSAVNAAASVNNINSLSFLLNFGSITQTHGTSSDYGSI